MRDRWIPKISAIVVVALVISFSMVWTAPANEIGHKQKTRESLSKETSRPVEWVEKIEVDGLILRLGEPRVVAEEASGHCWYPDLQRFSSGELMLSYSLNPDAVNPVNAQAVLLSRDGGLSFDFGYDVNGFHNSGGEPRVVLPDNRIVGPASLCLKPDPPGQSRCFVTHWWSYEKGGRRYTFEPWAATIEGLPRDVETFESGEYRTRWARINWFSDIVVVEENWWVSTISLHYPSDERESTVAVVSENKGRNWRYLSTISDSDDLPDASEGFDEPCLIRLADGDLMCVSRVGNMNEKLARSYSNDSGRSWSPLDRLPAWGVAPQMLRLNGGVLALSTGRRGLYLWLSRDKRGREWQSLNLLEFHNAHTGSEEQIDVSDPVPTKHQTTAYTAMIEFSPDRIMLVYDRNPFGWDPVPENSEEKTQIYLLEILVQRK